MSMSGRLVSNVDREMADLGAIFKGSLSPSFST